jgi:hypothetical protein
MSTDAGSSFDKLAAGRDAGDNRLEEESRDLLAEDAAEEALEDDLKEDDERKRVHDEVNDAF